MYRFSLHYGKDHVHFQLPRSSYIDFIEYPAADETKHLEAPEALIENALNSPIGSPRLEILAKGKQSVVILISDNSRLAPSNLFLEPIIRRLNEAGIADSQIKIIIALGMHRKMTEDEIKALVGSTIFNRIAVINHSALSEDCVEVGTTSIFGTPIEINRLVAEADLRIATGNIEPHRLVGMSGGVKALFPGVASSVSIEAHHKHSQSYRATPGETSNPLHKDIVDVLTFVPIHFLFNVIVDHHRRLHRAVAGHIIKAHKQGIQIAAESFLTPTKKEYDLVIASAGGYPKDIQLYQAIKTLQNASQITKPGGSIILAAKCQELFGNGLFQLWVETIQDRDTMVKKLKQQFVLGPHKIEQIDSLLKKHQVYLYSDMPEPIVQLIGFIPVHMIEQTVNHIVSNSAVTPSIAIMPAGAITFPVTEQKE